LLEELGRRASDAVSLDTAIPTRERQVSLLRNTLSELQSASHISSDDFDLIAEHLRRATDFVGKIVGRVDVEDLLDVIFSQFCIGK
jgi:tRNA modification GTPase